MYLTETSAPTRGRPTKTYLETVLLHKSPLVSGCTVTVCVSWKRTVYMYLVCGLTQKFTSDVERFVRCPKSVLPPSKVQLRNCAVSCNVRHSVRVNKLGCLAQSNW
jgi:hypothetical protein